MKPAGDEISHGYPIQQSIEVKSRWRKTKLNREINEYVNGRGERT
ncbi:MAG: hypothetical protein PHI12_03570 [Dehalococcoidales bacterium]|nr:hypothetical protein [Dehalococcoidales bacterium]